MALQTHPAVDELLRRVHDAVESRLELAVDDDAPCPDAKAECHEQARALGIVLVEAPEPEGDTRRHRSHPMA